MQAEPAVDEVVDQVGEADVPGSVSSGRREAMATPVIANPASSAAPAIINDGAMSELPVLGNDPAACPPPPEGEPGVPGPDTAIDVVVVLSGGWGG